MANTTWSTTDRLNVTLSGTNNLVVTASASAGGVRSIDRLSSGSFYWETTVTTASSSTIVGVGNAGTSLAAASSGAGQAIVNCGTGGIAVNGTAQTGLGAITSGGVVCVAVNLATQLIWFRLGAAGNWNGSGTANPATGVGGYSIAALTSVAIPLYAVMECATSGGVLTANFGDTAFTGAVPAGFTSGFTAGASPPLNEIVTQVAVEEWGVGTPAVQLTQIAIEQWAQVSSVNTQVVLTQVALEQWASVAAATPPPSRGGPMISLII
jgi:hypothetical protein